MSFGVDDFVDEAKRIVIADFEGGTHTKRKWLEADLDSYSNAQYRIKILVLEGSPPKGMIIINYSRHYVQAFDCIGILLKQFDHRSGVFEEPTESEEEPGYEEESESGEWES